MCGRFSLTFDFEDLAAYFDLARGFDFDPRYNVAPTDAVPAVREEEGERRLVRLRWGLHPFWADAPPDRSVRMINARVETCHRSPAYRAAFRHRRCIVPASGFYEWQKKDGGRRKHPFHIRFVDHRPLALAGLWERWEDPSGRLQAVESCTIITGPAPETLAGIHDRAPILLRRADFAAWLDPGEQDVKKLRSLLGPWEGTDLELRPVSTRVNNPRNEGPGILEPEDGV